MVCINEMFTQLTMAVMHESVIRLLACAKIASRNRKDPVDEPWKLANWLQISSATLTNWKSRGVSKHGALKAEMVIGCSPAFVLEGRGMPFDDMPALPPGMSAFAALAYPELWDADIRGVAHDLSQARNTESLPRLNWGDLMEADLSRPFELEVIDDALAPEIFKGCIALLDPHRPPEPAWPVLVRDREGNFYLRDYEAGPRGRWNAVARARGFAPMDSESNGLQIIAAMDGYKRPRPAAS